MLFILNYPPLFLFGYEILTSNYFNGQGLKKIESTKNASSGIHFLKPRKQSHVKDVQYYDLYQQQMSMSIDFEILAL